MAAPALVWFRDDLRLADHPALTASAERGMPICALYLLDEASPGLRSFGGASRWWLHNSLERLTADLAGRGVPLVLRRGPAAQVVPALAREIGAGLVAFNRRPGWAEAAVDAAVEAALAAEGTETAIFSASLLTDPASVVNSSGEPFRVFTPFWRALQSKAMRAPRPAPQRLVPLSPAPASEPLGSWGLLPTTPDWAGGLREAWTPGEAGARARLDAFLEDGLTGYADGRDRPDQPATSRLSPHLRFGELSPAMVFAALGLAAEAGPGAPSRDVEKFRAELGWREFAHHLLEAFPELARRNYQPAFDDFPWRDDPVGLRAWQRGLTGYPVVDAGMRELWATGWMHNRVRMVAASFLVKHLMIDWREGEAWFWDTLVDADPANNPASWQWVAGSGADAAPFFRVFNPVLQGRKFDPDGTYVRRWVPELAELPSEVIHAPWEAGGLELAKAGLRLGEDYPAPIVEHRFARDRALAAYRSLGTLAQA